MELIVNNHNIASIKVSLFFLIYNYYIKPIKFIEDKPTLIEVKSPI